VVTLACPEGTTGVLIELTTGGFIERARVRGVIDEVARWR
jgi:hypothetical protein